MYGIKMKISPEFERTEAVELASSIKPGSAPALTNTNFRKLAPKLSVYGLYTPTDRTFEQSVV